MESHNLIALSFRKLNEGKSQKTSDLRRNLLVFTVISACRTQRTPIKKINRKRTISLDQPESSPPKQPLCSFEQAFCKSPVASDDSNSTNNLTSEEEIDNSYPTQVPISSYHCQPINQTNEIPCIDSFLASFTEPPCQDYYANQTELQERDFQHHPQCLPVAAF